MAKIIPLAKRPQETLVPPWKMELPITSYVQIYPRVSTPEQKKNVSAEMQVDRTFALACGWPQELIILDDRDLGLSGQLRMEDRPAFNDMLRRIADGQVKIVIAAQVDRLFRDRWGKEYSKFMEICYLYGAKVVTLNHSRTSIDFMYDFSISWHVDQFRRKCEDAWRYIENHVGRMLAAKDELGESGRWAGGNLPVGFLVDRREKVDGKKNPNYRKIYPYMLHAEKIRWLYKRYRELGANIQALFREIYRQEAFFPPFDSTIDDEILGACNILKMYQREMLAKGMDPQEVEEIGRNRGFTLRTASGLRKILVNPVYAGIWVYKGVVIDAENHEPIVDFGTFLYAFNRLAPTNLDGTPNEVFLSKCSGYAKRHRSDQPAILTGKAVAADPHYRIYVKDVAKGGKEARGEARKVYTFWLLRQEGKTIKYMLSVEEVDSFFLQKFIRKLQDADEFEDFLSKEEDERQTQLQLVQDIERDVKAVESLMAKIRGEIRSGALTNKTLLQEANDQYSGLEEELVRLERRKEKVARDTTHVEKRRTYKQLIKEVGDRWDELVPAEMVPDMVDTFVEKAVLDNLSPRFYKIAIHWRDPEWGIDEMICFREGNPSTHWIQEEDDLLRQHYRTMTSEELMKLFPHRSFNAIKHRAVRLKLASDKLKTWENIPNSFCLLDYQLMEQYSVTEEQLRAEPGAKLVRSS